MSMYTFISLKTAYSS